MTGEDIRAEVKDLLDTVKVLRQGVRRAVDRYDELERRITPNYDDMPDADLEAHMARLEVYGLEAVDVWLCAIMDDLGHDGRGVQVRSGRCDAEMYERVGADSPLPHPLG